MNTRVTIRAFLIGVACQFACGPPHSSGAEAGFTKLSFIEANVFLAFTPETTNWIALDASADLRAWVELANLATTNSITFLVDQGVAQTPCRFYRLRQPGTTVENAATKWPTNANLSYQFQLVRVDVVASSLLTGNVTVTAGQKVISNAEENGQPLANPNPADFPSVEELFVLLQNAQTAGCRQVWVTYDQVLGYPVKCVIDQRVVAIPEGQAFTYSVTGLTVNGS